MYELKNVKIICGEATLTPRKYEELMFKTFGLKFMYDGEDPAGDWLFVIHSESLEKIFGYLKVYHHMIIEKALNHLLKVTCFHQIKLSNRTGYVTFVLNELTLKALRNHYRDNDDFASSVKEITEFEVYDMIDNGFTDFSPNSDLPFAKFNGITLDMEVL